MIILADSSQSSSYAIQAQKNHLFVPGWHLVRILAAIKKDNELAQIVICLDDNNEAVGVATKLLKDLVIDLADGSTWTLKKGLLSIFIKRAYRKKDIGAEMVKILKDNTCYACSQSKRFWKKMNIKIKDTNIITSSVEEEQYL